MSCRQFTVFHASAGKQNASSFTETGCCFGPAATGEEDGPYAFAAAAAVAPCPAPIPKARTAPTSLPRRRSESKRHEG